MKRTLIVAVALMLAMSVVAPVFSTGTAEEGEVVLTWPTIWVGQDSKAATITKLVDMFNAENEGSIRVEIEPNPDYDGYKDKINTQLVSGAAPDLFIFDPNPTTFQYYESDILMDFTEELSGSWANDFVDGYIQASSRDGRTKSVPYETGITPIWYNSKLLADAGYDEFPTTIDDFWDMAEALKANGVVPTSQMTGGNNAWTSMLWFSHFVGSFGGPDAWDKPLSDPLYENAAEMLLMMYQDGNTTRDAVGGGPGESGGHYMAGDTAVFINGPWYVGRIRDDAPDTYEVTKLAPAPQAGDYFGHQLGFMLSNLAAANTEDAAQREAVVKWMRFMTEPDNVRLVSEDAGSMFAIKYELSENADPLQREFVRVATDATFVTNRFTDNFPVSAVAEFGQALSAMALGEITPAEFIKILDEASN